MSDHRRSGLDSFYAQHWRWFVLATLFFATFICYFDRQTLGTAIEPIATQFHLDNAQRGNLLSAFIFSYAICLFPIGFIIDRVRNLRVFFPVMLIGWSISTILIGFAQNYGQILWLRVALGVWESVNFPICILIIGHIFPAVERSLATGIFASGAFLATLAAPPFVIYFSNNYDWRYSFVIAGLLGLLWLVPWFIIFRPERYVPSWIHAPDLDRHSPGSRSSVPPGSNWLTSLVEVISQPGFWGIALMGLGIVPSLYFATQWFPSYFTQQLHQAYDASLAWKLSLIYLMQDVGLCAGGWLVMWLSQHGLTILNARKTVITMAAVPMLSVFIVPHLKSVEMSVAFLSLYVCGIGAFLGNQHAFKQDIDKQRIATVSALVGGIETGFAAFVVQRVGFVTKDSADFTLVFYVLTGLAAFGLIVVHVFVKPKWYRVA